MAHVRHETIDRLRQKICLGCGYRGPEVQPGFGGDVFVCPACGCDLYARPPRSYAEMEAIGAEAGGAAACVEEPAAVPGTPTTPGSGVTVLTHWLRRVVRRLLHWR